MSCFPGDESIRMKLDILVFHVHLTLSDLSPESINTSILDYNVLIALYGSV